MKFRNLSHSSDELIRRIHFFLGEKNKLNALWWGINLGVNTRFDGKCYFKRYPGSVIKIGKNCKLLSRVNSNLIGIDRPCSFSTITAEAVIEIGANCGFSGTVIGAFKYIKIGNNVRCGANTLITDSDWHTDDPRTGKPKDVIIGDNVWLGVNTVVLKGVTIGDNTIIGANSVVTRNIPANVIAAGNPCKVIRNIINAL
ncbi:MAG TPA: acyltransferase [Ignavibacteria bacterium]